MNFPQNAQWIGDRQRAITGEPPCPFLRHQFFLTAPVKRATLHWTALGVADMHLNGKKVGTGFLMPGWSDFHHRVQVISHDVSKVLKPGANMLGAILADGWYSGTLAGNNQRNHWGTHPQLLAWLDVELGAWQIWQRGMGRCRNHLPMENLLALWGHRNSPLRRFKWVVGGAG